MLKELQKKSTKSVVITSIFIIIIGIVFAIPFVKNLSYFTGGGVVFEELAPEEIKPGMYVNIELKDNFGWFIEEYVENTKTHKQTTEYLYYVIWTGDDYATDYRYMGIRVPYSYMDEMEEMANNTYEGYYSDPIPFSGYIRDMTSEDKGYFEEYFTSGGFTVEEYEACTLPYYIEVMEESDSHFYTFLLIIGAVFFIWAAIRLIKVCTGGYLKKFRKDVEASGYSIEGLESDFEYSKNIDMKLSGVIGLGQRALYYMDGGTPRMVSTRQLLWAYTNITQHRTNGIPTGKTYGVAVFAEGRGNFLTIGAKNEANAKEILQYLATKYPWMIVGYSDDLRKLYSQDIATFKSLKYDKEISDAIL